MDTVAIVGVGLIGGSFGLALRKAGFKGRIVGVSSPATIAAAKARGVIDKSMAPEAAAATADLIYLAQPIHLILDAIDKIDDFVRPGTLITDAGSTKGVICAQAEEKIRRGRFVGGHPMAGKESRGVEHADADLFQGRPYVLTGRDKELEQWIERMGARLVFLDPREHDRLVAIASHLPQMASIAIAELIGETGATQIAGPGAIDMTRLALSSYDIWRDILDTNAESIEKALDAAIEKLESLRGSLRDGRMKGEFERAAREARALRDG